MRIMRRLRQLWHRRQFESDIEEEMRIHIHMAEERLREEGTMEDEARSLAKRQFGNQALALEESRSVWIFARIEELAQDMRYAARVWMRSPGFAVTVIATIGLALGLNTAIFTAFDHYVLRPLAVRDPGSLYQMEWKTRSGAGHFFTWEEYESLSKQEHLLSGSYAGIPLMGQLDQHPALGQLVTPNFFEMLGAKVSLGRPFAPGDAPAPGIGAYIVLSHTCWTSKYGSDAQILGRKVFGHGQPFEVIGVAAPEFKGIGPAPADFWVPLTMHAALNNDVDVFAPTTSGSLIAVIRLRPGLSLEAAKAALLAWSRQQTKDYPRDQQAAGVYMESRASAVPLNQNVLLAISPVFIAFALVLLPACANVSNMMLARAVARQREIGVRLSLGAGRLRLIRQLLVEAFLLSSAAALAGFVVSELTLLLLRDLFYRTIPAQFVKVFQLPEMHPDYRVFGFVVLAAAATTVLFGLLPAVQATRGVSAHAARGEFGSDLRPSRLRNALLVAQVFICTLMLITSLILLRSETRITQRDLRVDPRGVLDVRVAAKFAARLSERLRREVIVEDIAAVSRAPLYGGLPAVGIGPLGNAQFVRSYFNMVSPEYLDLLRMRLVAGRNFTQNEATEHAAVVIVSEATARRLWPDESPIGKELRIDADRRNRLFASPAFARAQVIGVAGDVVNGFATATVDPACVYFPVAAGNTAVSSLLVRVHGDVEAAGTALERVVQEAAPGASGLIVPLQHVVDTTIYPFRVIFWTGSCAVGPGRWYLSSPGSTVSLSFLSEPAPKGDRDSDRGRGISKRRDENDPRAVDPASVA